MVRCAELALFLSIASTDSFTLERHFSGRRSTGNYLSHGVVNVAIIMLTVKNPVSSTAF